MDGIVFLAVTVVVVIIGGAMFSAGRISVLDDCNNYGASVIGESKIECQSADVKAGG